MGCGQRHNQAAFFFTLTLFLSVVFQSHSIGLVPIVQIDLSEEELSAACDYTEFQCKSGQCIRQLYRCDTEPDCGDGSDEENCSETVCDDLEFRCQNGQCIPKSYTCDGESDCPGGTDESQNLCSWTDGTSNNTSATSQPATVLTQGICEYNQYQCRTRSGGNCISRSYVCDNDNDCLDGLDERDCNNCVKPVDVTQLPECKVTFYRGSTRDRDFWSCLGGNYQNTIRAKASTSYHPETSDPFADPKVNYMKMVCSAPYGIDFYFDGVGAVETFKVYKSQKSEHYPYSYSPVQVKYVINVDTILSPSSTGNYTFRSLSDPTKEVSLFVLVENDRKPYLIGRGRILSAKKTTVNNGTETKVILPCVGAKFGLKIFLFKQDGSTWTKVENTSYIYDPMQGFILDASASLAGNYHCTTDETHKTDLDLVTVIVDSALVSEEAVPAKEPSIKIVFDNKYGGGAACHTINITDSAHHLTLTNLHANNPTEARLAAGCFTKGYKLCGLRPFVSNHNEAYQSTSDARSPCAKTQAGQKCTRISNLYPQGVLVCKLGNETVVQEYFFGLDKKAYRSWDEAPEDAILRLELPTLTGNSSIQTSTTYTIKCPSIGMEFVRNPVVLTAKYATSVTEEKLSTSTYTEKSILFSKSGQVTLKCTDYLWRTNEPRSYSVNITVTAKPCTSLQWACASGQCIRSSYRCDGGGDCVDRSDEINCPPRTTTTRAPSTCSYSQFRCNDGLCKPRSYRCDGDRDCYDGSDELGCPTTTTSTTTTTAATTTSTTTTTTTTTVPPRNPCTSSQFQCTSGLCVTLTHKCDGEPDCDDLSDEIGCPTTTTTSTVKPDISTTQDTRTAQSPESLHHSEDHTSESHSNNLMITFICIAVLVILLAVVAIAFKVYKSKGNNVVRHIRFNQDEAEVLM